MQKRKALLLGLALPAMVGYGVFQFLTHNDNHAGTPKEIVLRIPIWPMQTLEPSVWDPQCVLNQGTIFEGLFGYDSALNIVPKMAQTWTISPNRQSWVFHLRRDRFWSNGEPVTARDFIYGWEYFCNPKTPSETWASMFPSILHALDYKAGSVPLDSVGFHALDDSTLEVRLNRPLELTSYLCLASAVPLNKTAREAAIAVGEGDFWWTPKFFVGNGPYIPTSFVPDGEIQLVKNPHYTGTRGNVDRFELKAINMSSQNVQIQQYEAGELDVAHVLTLGDYTYAVKAKHLQGDLQSTPEIGFTGIQMARTVNPLMGDPDLRKAIALALDKQDIALNVMGGRVIPTDQFGPPDDSLFQGVVGTSANLEAAKASLKKSQYHGETIFLFTPPATDVKGLALVSESIQSQLRAIGMNIEIENMEQDLLTGPLATYVWGGGYIDDKRYERPGLTLFPGKVLWKNPAFLLRGADNIWYWQNFKFETQLLRKAITLERMANSKQEKGDQDKDWEALKPLRDSVAFWQRQVDSTTTNPLLRKKLLAESGDPVVAFDKIRTSITAATTKAERMEKWRSAKDYLLDNKFNYLTHLQNGANREGNELLAELETLTLQDERLIPVLQRLLQLSLDGNWIVPLFSEKIVYLKRSFIANESMNKFGVWYMLFNLSSIQVDTAAYCARSVRPGK